MCVGKPWVPPDTKEIKMPDGRIVQHVCPPDCLCQTWRSDPSQQVIIPTEVKIGGRKVEPAAQVEPSAQVSDSTLSIVTASREEVSRRESWQADNC